MLDVNNICNVSDVLKLIVFANETNILHSHICITIWLIFYVPNSISCTPSLINVNDAS